MKNEIIEQNRNQTNGKTHSQLAAAPPLENTAAALELLRHLLPGAVDHPTSPRADTNPDLAADASSSLNGHRGSSMRDSTTSDPSAPGTLNFKPETLNRFPTRVGKIARLPLEIREFVNESLRSGHTYATILEELEKLGHPGISDNNISNWKHGGYVDWLRAKQEAEARLALPKALERCTRSTDIDRLQQNAIALAADKLAYIICQFDHERALHMLSQKPEQFPRYIAALGTLARSTADLAKAFDLLQNREATIRDHLTPPDSANPTEPVDPPTEPEHPSRLDPSQPIHPSIHQSINPSTQSSISSEGGPVSPKLPSEGGSPLTNSSQIQPNPGNSNQFQPPRQNVAAEACPP